MIFTGTYEHTIDAKRRLAIPSEIRSILEREARQAGQEGPLRLYVALGDEGSLALYTPRVFEKRAAELDHSGLDADQLLEYERYFYSLAVEVVLDAQGRIRLPEHLLKLAKLGTEVVLIGAKDHLEVRDRKSWMEGLERFLASPQRMLMNPRRAMRPGPSDAGPQTRSTAGS